MKHIDFSDEEIFFDVNNNLHSNAKWFPENHYHNFIEIYFLESGECDYFIEDKVFRLLAGDMVVIKNNIIHNTVYGEKVCSRMLINCSNKFLPQCMISAFPKAFLFRNHEKSEEINGIFREIKKQYENKNEFSGEIVACYVRLLLLIAGSSENMYTEKTKHKYTEAAAEFANKNYAFEISLSKVAEKLSVSAEHLSRQFKKDTGIAFSEYVNLLRFKKAEELLASGKRETIISIAHMCGFNDSNYFSSKFKKIYGVSPLKWRNSKSKLVETQK